MAETQKNWYVLRAVSGKEAKVKEYIEGRIETQHVASVACFQVLYPWKNRRLCVMANA